MLTATGGLTCFHAPQMKTLIVNLKLVQRENLKKDMANLSYIVWGQAQRKYLLYGFWNNKIF